MVGMVAGQMMQNETALGTAYWYARKINIGAKVL
jgi:hypothetical protein